MSDFLRDDFINDFVPEEAVQALIAEGYAPERVRAAEAKVESWSYRPLPVERAVEVMRQLLDGAP